MPGGFAPAQSHTSALATHILKTFFRTYDYTLVLHFSAFCFFLCQRRERTRSVRNANRHPLLPVLDIKGNIQKVLVLAALVQLRFDLLPNLFFLLFQGFGEDKVEGKANL